PGRPPRAPSRRLPSVVPNPREGVPRGRAAALTRDLYRRDSMLSVQARRGPRRIRPEALDQLIPQPLSLDHVVDDQVGGELVEVDVLAVLLLELLATAGSFRLRKLRELV